MTYGGSGNDRLSKNQRREAARDKAKALREQQKKKERRNRVFLQGGIAVGILAVLAVVALVLVTSLRPAGAGPLNMQSDGITIGTGEKAVRTPAIPANGTPVATKRDKSSDVIDIRIYLDYFCPVCQAFETTNHDQIQSWLDRGAATVEIHPVSFLDRSSLGTHYASRSANAAACVSNYSPDDYWAFSTAMYAKQPKEETVGLDNAQIIDVIKDAGVHNMSKISSCVNDEKFKDWVKSATDRATHGPLPDADQKTVTGTPLVLVNGISYPGAVDDAAAFAAFVVQAAGASFNENSTPTPTPTP
jgi:protein-disulfide isomerase